MNYNSLDKQIGNDNFKSALFQGISKSFSCSKSLHELKINNSIEKQIEDKMSNCNSKTKSILKKFMKQMDNDKTNINLQNETFILNLEKQIDEARGLKLQETTSYHIETTAQTMLAQTDWNLNNQKVIFKPKCLNFHNKLLQYSLETNLRQKPDNSYFQSNPYLQEIQDFTDSLKDEYGSYQGFLKESLEIEHPDTIEQTQFVCVDDMAKLDELLEDLKREKVIAVDVEHHDGYSQAGLTCLLQISSINCDQIVDVLKFLKHRSENQSTLQEQDVTGGLQKLNIIFTDPNKVKIFHGGKKDIEWLQKDLGLQIVNMFDTYLASRKFQLSSYSQANLCKEQLNIHLDKAMQTADWRIRPLTSQMVEQARKDTHYLLYIYERLKEDLINLAKEQKIVNLSKFVVEVYEESSSICKYSYSTPMPPSIWDSIYKAKKQDLLVTADQLNKNTIQIFQILDIWRDKKARECDMRPMHLVSNSLLAVLARSKPIAIAQLQQCQDPLPPFLQRYHKEVCDVIARAIENLEETLQYLLDITEANDRLRKYKELKTAFEHTSHEDLEVDIFRNLQKPAQLKTFEAEFNLNDLKKLNQEEDQEVNQVYDEILSNYEISVGTNSKTKLDNIVGSNELQNSQSEYERVSLDNLSNSILKMQRHDSNVKDQNSILNEFIDARKNVINNKPKRQTEFDRLVNVDSAQELLDNVNLMEKPKIPKNLSEMQDQHYHNVQINKNKKRNSIPEELKNEDLKYKKFTKLDQSMTDEDYLRELGQGNDNKKTRETKNIINEVVNHENEMKLRNKKKNKEKNLLIRDKM